MIKHETGSLLKRLRVQKDISLNDLAACAGVSASTISRIENGKTMPAYKLIAVLLQKLGYDPSNFAAHFVSKKEQKWQKRQDEISNLLYTWKTSEAHDLIVECENDKEFMQVKFNEQFVLVSRATIMTNNGEDFDKIMDVLLEAIKINIPTFSYKYIEDYFISNIDFRIINMMAILHDEYGQSDKAINLMMALKSNVDKHSVDKAHKGKLYPAIIYNLTKYLGMAGRYRDAVELCDEGIKVCIETGWLVDLPEIIYNKACCLYDLGEKEECEKLLTMVYYTCLAYKKYETSEMIKGHAQNRMDIDFSPKY